MTPEVKFNIAGKERELRFGTLAIMKAEEVLGVSDLEGELFKKLSLRSTVILTEAALTRPGKKTLSIQEIAEWVDGLGEKRGDTLAELVKQLVRAYLFAKGYSAEEVNKRVDAAEEEVSTEGKSEPGEASA